MSYMYDELSERGSQFQGYWAGLVNSVPSDFSKRISVIIPGLDPDIAWAKCRWMPRNDVELPQLGNACLCVFDDNNEVWVVSWWPFN